MMLTTNARRSRIFLHEAPSYARAGFRILCATDLSARSDQAIERAIRVSEAVGAQCMLLHVVPEKVPLRLTGRRAERAQATLEWHLRRFSHARVKPSVSVRVGVPNFMIARVARQWGADLIVLGSHRRRSADTLIPSTAEWISHRAGRPVLVANADASHDYSGVTFVARRQIGLYVQLADQFELLESAQLSLVPHVSILDRVSLLCARAIDSRGSTLAVQLHGRVQRRAQEWMEEAGLHLLGIEMVARPITSGLLLSRVSRGQGPQLLVAGLNRTFTFPRSLAQLTAAGAVRSAACDVLLSSDRAARSVLRLPGVCQQETCEDATC